MNFKPTTSSNESEANNSGKLPCKKSLTVLADRCVTQQPTTEANEGHQPTALPLPEQPTISFKLSPGTLPDTQSQVVRLNSESAWIVDSSPM